MKITLRYDTVQPMMHHLRLLKQGKPDEKALDVLLDHPDYHVEFTRYGANVTKDVYREYMVRFPELSEDEIDNMHLKAHHRCYLDAFENVDHYEASLSMLNIDQQTLDEQAAIAKAGLPDDLALAEVHVVFTLGIGASFGYVHQHHVHVDFLQLVKEKTPEELSASLAHEVHHVGFNKLLSKMDMQTLPLESLFYLYFSGEGLAVKYCNNAEGVLSKPIYDGPVNVGLDAWTWDYLRDDFDEAMRRVKTTVKAIRDGCYTKEDLHHDLQTYWMNPRTDNQANSDIPALKQLRLYSVGNDIWGIIHDVFGKEKVYDTLQNLAHFAATFNAALEHIGKTKYCV